MIILFSGLLHIADNHGFGWKHFALEKTRAMLDAVQSKFPFRYQVIHIVNAKFDLQWVRKAVPALLLLAIT
jgi:hypothetical protein